MILLNMQDTYKLIVDALQILSPQLVLRSCLLVCTSIFLVQWLFRRGSYWTDQRSTRVAFCLSILLHLCVWMGCTVVSESGRLALGGGDGGTETAEVVAEQITPIRNWIPNSEASASGIAGGTSATPAVWERIASHGTLEHERSRLELPANDFEEQPIDREIAAAPSVARQVPSLPVTSESDLPTPDRTPQAIESRVPLVSRVSRAPAMSQEAIVPEGETLAEARPDARPSTPAFRRTTAGRGNSSTPQTASPGAGQAMTGDDGEFAVRRRSSAASAASLGKSVSGSAESLAGLGGPNAGAPLGEVAGPPRAPRGSSVGSRDAKMAIPVNEVQTLLVGRVTDAETGLPLAGAIIRIDRVNQDPLVARTTTSGLYRLAMTELPDNVAVTAIRQGYLPGSRNLETAGTRLDFALAPVTESVISVESRPVVHHLGNDVFSGEVNSQFQQKTEGPRWTAKFTVTAEQLRFNPRSATVTVLVKGMQLPAAFRINESLTSQQPQASPTDGSFGLCELRFDPKVLKFGENVIRIDTFERGDDQDDFEFVNVQVRLHR